MLPIQEKVGHDEHGVGDQAEVVQDPKAFRCEAATPIFIALRAGGLRGGLSPALRPETSAQLLLHAVHPGAPRRSGRRGSASDWSEEHGQ